MAVDIRTQGLQKPVSVAEYLFARLYEIGIRSVHGVPGDFNLVALDFLPKAKLKWVGSVNELNAGVCRLAHGNYVYVVFEESWAH
jgi:pyruvate decarboxylase